MYRSQNKSNSGFSLLNTLLIMLCFSIILFGVLNLFVNSLKFSSRYKSKLDIATQKMFLFDFWHLVMKNRVYISDDNLLKLGLFKLLNIDNSDNTNINKINNNKINNKINNKLALYKIYKESIAKNIFNNLDIKSDLLLKISLYPEKAIFIQKKTEYLDILQNQLIDLKQNFGDKFSGIVFIYPENIIFFKPNYLQCDFNLIINNSNLYKISCLGLGDTSFINNWNNNKINNIKIIIIWPLSKTAYFLSKYKKGVGLYQMRMGVNDYKQLLLSGVKKLNFNILNNNSKKHILQISYDFLGELRSLSFAI